MDPDLWNFTFSKILIFSLVFFTVFLRFNPQSFVRFLKILVMTEKFYQKFLEDFINQIVRIRKLFRIFAPVSQTVLCENNVFQYEDVLGKNIQSR